MPEVHDVFVRFWMDLLARPSGPFALRFMVQPLMAAWFAICNGVGDARRGRSPYFLTVLRDSAQRRARLVEGIAATATILVVGLVLDTAYQFIKLHAFYPGEALAIAFALAFVPYLLIRGPADRIARWWFARNASQHVGARARSIQ